MARWFVQSVAQLVRAGHTLDSIKRMTLGQFQVYVETVDQVQASERIGLVTDLGVAAAAAMGGEAGSDAMEEHLDLLADTARGVKTWQLEHAPT